MPASTYILARPWFIYIIQDEEMTKKHVKKERQGGVLQQVHRNQLSTMISAQYVAKNAKTEKKMKLKQRFGCR